MQGALEREMGEEEKEKCSTSNIQLYLHNICGVLSSHHIPCMHAVSVLIYVDGFHF